MDPNPPPVATVEDSAVPFPQRLPRVPTMIPPPEPLPQQPPPVTIHNENTGSPVRNGGLSGMWAQVANMSAIAVALCLVVTLVFFLMNFVRDESKAGREQHRDDVKTLVEPIKDLSVDTKNTIQEMKEGRKEQRDWNTKCDERFEKQNEKFTQILDQNKAALDEIRKMKMP